MTETNEKNIFFGMEIEAPWSHSHPKGRVIPEKSRHSTLAFLGPMDDHALKQHLFMMPKPKTKLGFAGVMNELLFLPEKHPRVVAYGAEIFFKDTLVKRYQNELVEWLNLMGFPPENQERGWLNHVSIARGPFDEKAWRHDFQKLPFISTKIHLYKSVGNLHYEPQWTYDFIPPFSEIEHTADLAFIIRGDNFNQVRQNAEVALSFRFPSLFSYFEEYKGLSRVENLIRHLNKAISLADAKEGSPLKSVSLHGEIVQKEDIFEWEMIVDV